MPFIFTFLLMSTMIEDSVSLRIMRYFRFLLVGQLLLGSSCLGFLQNLAVTKCHRHHQAAVRISISSSVATASSVLLMSSQQPERSTKPPRFAQKAHSSKINTSTPPTKKKNKDTSRPASPRTQPIESQTKPLSVPSMPFNTEKSIEDMEERLMKRWGTLEQPNGGRPVPLNGLQRPVLDPWEKETERRQQPILREFYDEDDEGFEIMEMEDGDDEGDWKDAEWEEEDGSPMKSPRMKISHLIAPKPAGGRGTFEPPATVQPSYFFNPNKQAAPPVALTTTPSTKDRNSKSEANSDTGTTTPTKIKRVQPPAAQPLLDDGGSELLLTVQEAQRRFESCSTDEAVEAMADEDEAPLVAYQQSPQLSWTNLGITSEILIKNLDAMSCSNPLVVQQKTIPHILTGNDVLVGMYTGSGKTLSFLTPLIQRLLWQDDEDDPGLTVIIVAPGRELASQIVSVARKLVEGTPYKVQLAIGGTTFGRNLEQIRKQKPNILVGTPGRIAELVVGKPGEKTGRLKINNLQSLVLDEFDALLEYKPHAEPTRAILQTLQRRHGTALQSILCSATASDLMDSPKVAEYLRPGFATALADDDDAFVTGPNAKRPQVSKTVMHGVVHVPHKRFALDTIRRILHTEPVPQQILIFVESSHKVEVVVDKLGQQGIIAAPLHGGRNSDKIDRADVSKALREGFVGIVVATEMAARGLDAPLLTHVINMDLPTDASHYAHRAGRCGRGGRPGVVINMTTGPKERKVPQRFSEQLGIDMHTVEPRKGKLILVDPETQSIDES